MIKAECQCDGCGYTVRLTRKWIEFGAPICPVHMEPMVIDMPEEEGDGDGPGEE